MDTDHRYGVDGEVAGSCPYSSGTTISLRAGTYAPTTSYRIAASGTATAPITLRNHPGEAVLLDGDGLPGTPAPVGGSLPDAQRGVIHLERASFWRIAGLQITHGPYGLYCRDCSDNVFEGLVTRDNYESGLQIQGASSRNQVIDLDSHGNRDPRKNGESADGLAIKEGSGTGNVVRGARLWHNVDDGFDAWEFRSPITIERSAAWGNGVDRWHGSVAFDNAQGGFIDNGNPGASTLDHNTAWRNGGTGFDFADSRSALTRNLSVANRTQASLGASTGRANSWDLGGSWSLASTDASVLTGRRPPGGGIGTSPFLRPANGADVGARL